MNNNKNFDSYLYYQVITLSVLFIGMSVFGIFTAIGHFAFDNSIKNYLFLSGGFALLTASFILLLSLPKYKVLNIILISMFVCFTALTFIKKESIKAWFVGFNYSNFEQSMLAGTADVLNTTIYKEFLMDKNNRNVDRLKEYQNNPKQYTSINIEQVTNLRMFYASINNNDIKTKLNNMFNDNIVTQAEYADFQNFIATTNLDDKEVALLSIVTN